MYNQIYSINMKYKTFKEDKHPKSVVVFNILVVTRLFQAKGQ